MSALRLGPGMLRKSKKAKPHNREDERNLRDDLGTFARKMSQFLKDAESSVCEAQEHVESMTHAVLEMFEFFGESPTAASTEHVFGVFKSFVGELQRTVANFERQFKGRRKASYGASAVTKVGDKVRTSFGVGVIEQVRRIAAADDEVAVAEADDDGEELENPYTYIVRLEWGAVASLQAETIACVGSEVGTAFGAGFVRSIRTDGTYELQLDWGAVGYFQAALVSVVVPTSISPVVDVVDERMSFLASPTTLSQEDEEEEEDGFFDAVEDHHNKK